MSPVIPTTPVTGAQPMPTILRADARSLPLADDSVDLVVTSPPYYGLRSYQDGGQPYSGQIGAESTPAEYLDALVDVTRECVRILKPTGSIWVNLGDRYSTGNSGHSALATLGQRYRGGGHSDAKAKQASQRVTGRPTKSLLGIPWRYAIRCTDELGLVLRAEVVWSKPNGLPESVTDRVRRSHETWFHLTLQPHYYAAIDQIREPTAPQRLRGKQSTQDRAHRSSGHGTIGHPDRPQVPGPAGKLPGSVWEIATQPLTVPAELSVDHYAAFPMEWPRRLILGWSPRDVCTACGQGRRPVVASVAMDLSRPQARRAQQLADAAGLTEDHFAALVSVGVSDTGRGKSTQTGTGKNTTHAYTLAAEARAALGGYAREYLLRRPTRFDHRCVCPDTTAPASPGVVLDPFGGTGTTALVAAMHGRTGISIDASADYCRLAQWRASDPRQRAKAAQPRVPLRRTVPAAVPPKRPPAPGPGRAA
jgi:DNA modification methylase